MTMAAVAGGLDLSLSSTGIAWNHPTNEIPWQSTTIKTKAPPKTAPDRLRVPDRIGEIRDRVMRIFTSPVIAVSIEGYSMASRQSQKHGAGELGGVVKLALAEAGIPYAVVAPTSLKLWIAGHGHATKAEMMTQICLRSRREITSDDEADAIGLCWVTLEAIGIETPMHSAPDPKGLVANVRRQLPRALWP